MVIIGSGFQLVDAVGVVVLGHFSIDGQVRKEHFSKRHHNIFVVDNKQKLQENIIELLSFPGNTTMEIIVETDQYSGKTNNINYILYTQASLIISLNMNLKSETPNILASYLWGCLMSLRVKSTLLKLQVHCAYIVVVVEHYILGVDHI